MFAECFLCIHVHGDMYVTISISLRNACPLHYLDILQHQFGIGIV